MNLEEELKSVNLDGTINSLNAYAISRLKSVGVKDFNGMEAIDFVGDLILKVIEGKRDFSNVNCSFKEFLFGCLKSEIYNFFKAKKYISSDELPEIGINGISEDIMEKKRQVSEMLKIEGADDDEIKVFDCWADGIFKPAEIAANLGINVKDVYKITKRLERKREKIEAKASEIV